MKTSNIASGFDVELQLGSGWFLTALNLLNDNGLLTDDSTNVTITGVSISFEPGEDLLIEVAEVPFPIPVAVAISDDGSELIITSAFPQIPETRVPFGALSGLQGTPVITKHAGDADHEPAMIILADLKIQAGSQSSDPVDLDGTIAPRGVMENAQSFLPNGQHIAFGLGSATYGRFANNIWHTELRADDGSHPLPDADSKKGDWKAVKMYSSGGKLVVELQGEVPIDLWPDADVTIKLTLDPVISGGKLSFEISTDTDVDTGILGDIFAGVAGALTGGLLGIIIGALTGGILLGLAIGATAGFIGGIIALEIVEVVVEGMVQKVIKAKLNNEVLNEVHCNEDGIVQMALPESEGFNLSIVDSIPSSIPVYNEKPEGELLYERSLLVTSVYNDFTADSNGFAICGSSGTEEHFQPVFSKLSDATYSNDVLQSLTFTLNDGTSQVVPIAEVFIRASEGELRAPFKLSSKPEDAGLRIPEGKLCCTCLKPTGISREDSVVEEIEFDNGMRLNVPDAVALQDAAALVVTGYQLIHPSGAKPYYRAAADSSLENNFESLPQYEN